MTRYGKFFEWVYLIVAILSIIEVYNKWNTDRGKAQLFIFFAAIGIGMFFFRRHFRKKMEKRNNQS